MPANFVVMYLGREGSSPIIEQLGRHPCVRVPIFEDLDWYAAKDIYNTEDITRLAGLTLRCGDFFRARQIFAAGADAPLRSDTKAVGFKWRVWGDPNATARMLQNEKAVVFHLFRSDLLDMVASMYFTDHVIPCVERKQGINLEGGGHLQFKFAEMAPDRQKEFKDLLNAITFTIDRDRFVGMARNVVDAKQADFDRYLQPAKNLGIPIYSILYEDFVEHRTPFFARICSALGVSVDGISASDGMYRKVNNKNWAGQAMNWAEIEKWPPLIDLQARFTELIRERHCYLGPTSSPAED